MYVSGEWQLKSGSRDPERYKNTPTENWNLSWDACAYNQDSQQSNQAFFTKTDQFFWIQRLSSQTVNHIQLSNARDIYVTQE